MKRLALVTGGNRGLGLATCEKLIKRDYEVILTAREASTGAAIATETGAHFLHLDVTDVKSIHDMCDRLVQQFGRLDVLINNAGVLPDRGSAFEAKVEDIRGTLETNTLGPLFLCQRLIPLMKKNGYGRVVNVSSGMGQLSTMEGNYIAYRVSKAALNAVTRTFAAETEGTDILVNSVCPGWVRTDMGGKEAARSLEEGVSGIVWAAMLPYNGPSGGFYRDGKLLPW